MRRRVLFAAMVLSSGLVWLAAVRGAEEMAKAEPDVVIGLIL